MSKTIGGIPDYITHETYIEMIRHYGFDPENLHSMTFEPDGVYAIVFALDENGKRIPHPRHNSSRKNEVFIPVRRSTEDTDITTVSDVE